MEVPISRYDPEFGQIKYEGYQWVLEQRAILGDRAVPISIEFNVETCEISSLEREAIRLALTLPADVLRIVAPVVLQNYEIYRDLIGDEELPPLADPLEVWNEVTFSYLEVPRHEEYGLHVPSFMLNAECSWDPEHGLEVRFRNGIADAASQQGDLGY